MSEEPLEPLDPGLAELLAPLKRPPPAPPEALARIWSNVAVVPLAPPSPVAPKAAGSWLTSHTTAVVAAFVLGAGVGAATHAALETRAATVVAPVARAETPAVPPTAPVAEPLPTPVASATVAPSSAPHPIRPVPVASASGTLAAERAVIDAARGALAGGDATSALGLLDDYARRFPRPQLGEEREALVIQSLVVLGRYDDARAAAARFEAASPRSLFLPAIEASLKSIP